MKIVKITDQSTEFPLIDPSLAKKSRPPWYSKQVEGAANSFKVAIIILSCFIVFIR
jgi:hypothetical protein